MAAEPENWTDREAVLWQRLRTTGSAEAKERLFALHSDYARRIAGSIRRRLGLTHVSFEDLCQPAYLGLIEALDRYDPDLGVPFRAFASQRVSGSVRDAVDRLSERQEQIAWRARARKERLRSLVEDQDSADPLGALAELAVGLAFGFMLEGTGLFQSDENSTARTPTGYESAAWNESCRALSKEVARLPERERMILSYHYNQAVSFEEIARLLGLSKGRVSQLHRAALDLLRKRMGARDRFRIER